MIQRRFPQDRGNARDRAQGKKPWWNKLYTSDRWRQERRDFLARNPLCVMCATLKKIRAAKVVDHIKPHKGDMTLFWSKANWQAVCYHCHNSVKQSWEKSPALGCGADGLPADPSHHWNDELTRQQGWEAQDG